jgi:hypothetical protein
LDGAEDGRDDGRWRYDGAWNDVSINVLRRVDESIHQGQSGRIRNVFYGAEWADERVYQTQSHLEQVCEFKSLRVRRQPIATVSLEYVTGFAIEKRGSCEEGIF